MEFKILENCDYVMFPRLQEQGIEFKHVERESFKAKLQHVEGHGDFWLLYQQAKPHVIVHIQLAKDENDFDRRISATIPLLQLLLDADVKSYQ